MRVLKWLILLAPVALAGCISYTSVPPSQTTITVPPGSVVCPSGLQPPC